MTSISDHHVSVHTASHFQTNKKYLPKCFVIKLQSLTLSVAPMNTPEALCFPEGNVAWLWFVIANMYPALCP